MLRPNWKSCEGRRRVDEVVSTTALSVTALPEANVNPAAFNVSTKRLTGTGWNTRMSMRIGIKCAISKNMSSFNNVTSAYRFG